MSVTYIYADDHDDDDNDHGDLDHDHSYKVTIGDSIRCVFGQGGILGSRQNLVSLGYDEVGAIA